MAGRVVAVQFKARSDPAASLRDLHGLLTGVEADLFVLPEMFAAGYAFTQADQVPAEATDGPTVTALATLARSRGAWVVGGFPERAAEKIFNAAAVLDPSGALRFVYRKTLLFEADVWASPGDSGYCALDTALGRLGVGICMDLNDDAFLAHAAAQKLDLLAFPTNWVQEEGRVSDYWRWRLHTGWPAELGVEGGMADRQPVDALLIAANSYGREGRYELRGESAILHRGQVVTQAPPSGDGWIGVEIRS